MPGFIYLILFILFYFCIFVSIFSHFLSYEGWVAFLQWLLLYRDLFPPLDPFLVLCSARTFGETQKNTAHESKTQQQQEKEKKTAKKGVSYYSLLDPFFFRRRPSLQSKDKQTFGVPFVFISLFYFVETVSLDWKLLLLTLPMRLLTHSPICLHC